MYRKNAFNIVGLSICFIIWTVIICDDSILLIEYHWSHWVLHNVLILNTRQWVNQNIQIITVQIMKQIESPTNGYFFCGNLKKKSFDFGLFYFIDRMFEINWIQFKKYNYNIRYRHLINVQYVRKCFSIHVAKCWSISSKTKKFIYHFLLMTLFC
jgi:hypothetical protein